ncbi:2OG-Fe(II) oxygenase [Azospirillum picis]|uniref:2OG-Fe(II) oxygenase n=1 Tax=Azospirillum picis TaxID=488438 RepID=A0ABU0MJX3_9PROT|nr:2OG-Fe(II) oxygenase [Azospirillum picis]MBP2300019.1 hypothetical protein [Azospirillum picis]MDQ0533743.1 hypothetical protein [Azospirillum picis]
MTTATAVAAAATPDADAVAASFLRCLARSRRADSPYAHWLLSDALPEQTGDAIARLPWTPPAVSDTYGKRETNNASRTYFGAAAQAEHAVCGTVARAFQGRGVVEAIQRTCGVDLAGTSLRIEYCQDTDGFWLEPHTDIGVKKFTMLIYLSKGPNCAGWGTDVLDADKRVVARAPYAFNEGLIFIPGTDTWHGFEKRPIDGVRKSIIVNYVGPEWRARHELCFPDNPVA